MPLRDRAFSLGVERPRDSPSGDGQWFATRYNCVDRDNIFRLNPTSGAIQQTFTASSTSTSYYNHISYGDGGVWFGAYNTPENRIRQFDPAPGRIGRVIEMPDWYSGGTIHDQSFAESRHALWVLTYGTTTTSPANTQDPPAGCRARCSA